MRTETGNTYRNNLEQPELNDQETDQAEIRDTQHESMPASANEEVRTVDALIIGAGLGGLLSAAQLLQRGKQVLVVERLPHSGGRFTAKNFHGVQVSTGAVHMVPFGSSGVLAQSLHRLRVPYRFFDADVFGSFHVHGKQFRVPGLLGVAKFLDPIQLFWFLRAGWLMFFRPLPEEERELPFSQWLEQHVPLKHTPQLVAFFASISRFALSLELDQVSTAEVVRTTKNMLRFGAPAIVQGGCGEITRQLEQLVCAQGGELRLSCEVLEIVHDDQRATGVRMRDKASGKETFVRAPIIVSDIGPRATDALLQNHRVTQSEVLKKRSDDASLPPRQEAVGLKVHILSDISLIPHKGIMYCLDTQRVAGMVQPTNSDPSLAPAGKHLLISHQVIQSDDIEHERALALADLRMLFGPAFDEHCKVLTMGTYRGEWPVNRSVQGEDVSPQVAYQGLYLVGDAVKPAGFLMVEGVAQSVNRFLDLLDELDQERTPPRPRLRRHLLRHVVTPPSRLNALRWLWQAPGNSHKA
jgi:phytoene dehydrogenase-like protein